MNNYERYEEIEELLARHTARELAGIVLDGRKRERDLLESIANITDDYQKTIDGIPSIQDNYERNVLESFVEYIELNSDAWWIDDLMERYLGEMK